MADVDNSGVIWIAVTKVQASLNNALSNKKTRGKYCYLLVSYQDWKWISSYQIQEIHGFSAVFHAVFDLILKCFLCMSLNQHSFFWDTWQAKHNLWKSSNNMSIILYHQVYGIIKI